MGDGRGTSSEDRIGNILAEAGVDKYVVRGNNVRI